MAKSEASSESETSFEPDTSSEPKASLECAIDPEGVLVSMLSSSDWEAVTMLGATFVAVALVVHAARAGVTVPGVTYSNSLSSSL